MKKEGFTLIELIVSIVLLGLITTLVIPIYNGATGRTQERSYENKVKYIEVAAGNLATKIKNEIKATEGVVCLSIETLIKEGYLISDEKDKLYLTNPNMIKTNTTKGETGQYMGGIVELSYVNEDLLVEYKIDSTTCLTMIEFPDELDDRYIVDLTPPTGTFTINQGRYTNTRDLTLTLSPNDDAYYFCYSNRSNSCTIYYKLSDHNLSATKYRLPDSTQGTHHIYLWYRDKHENTMETPAHQTIVYDNVSPVGGIVINNDNTYTNNRRVSLGLSGTDATTGIDEECISNGTTCSNWLKVSTTNNHTETRSWELEAIEGNRTVSVWYRDLAMNISTRISDNIILDTVNPSDGTIVINDNATYTTKREVSLKLSSSDATSGLGTMCISLSTNCITWKTYSTTSTITLADQQGAQNVYVIYQDKAGNKSNQISDSIYLDTVKPTCTNSGDSKDWTKANRTIKWGCEDNESGCNPSTEVGETTYTETTKTASIAAYTINDKAGNSQSCVARTANVYVDKIPPTCTNSGDNESWTSSDVTIIWGCKDDDSKCNSSKKGGETTYTETTSTASIAAYTIEDNAENQTNCLARTASVYADKEAPTCTNSGDNGSWTSSNVTIYWGCRDDISGCNSSYDGGYNTFSSTTSTSEIAAYTIRDIAGNKKDCSARTASVYVDKTPPSCSISFTACNATGTGTCSDSDSGVKSGSSSSITAAATMSHSCKDNAGLTSSCSITKTYSACCSGSNTCKGGYDYGDWSCSITDYGVMGSTACSNKSTTPTSTYTKTCMTNGDQGECECQICSRSSSWDSCDTGANTCVAGYK